MMRASTFVVSKYLLAVLLLISGSFTQAAEDISSEVQVDRSRPLFDFALSQTYTNVSIQSNAAQAYATPVLLIIESITSPNVNVANPDGITAGGKPFFDYSALLGDTLFDPGELSDAIEVRFDNPERLRFDFTYSVMAELAQSSNNPPVANAGPDQTVLVGDTVTLNGNGSSDIDGNSLTFKWSFISRPSGSNATLSDSTAVMPSFDVDLFGSYVVQLVVNDGTEDSLPDTVTITTDNSPPVANAGPDQTAFVGDTVTLDGSSSSDVDGDSLTYSWSFIARPAGSGAVLSDAAAVNPTFNIDVFGSYTIQLIVNDGTVDSVADTITVTTENSPPVANAGPDQTALVGDTVTLDGSGSSDVDGNALSFSWSFTTRPAGSSAVLSNTTAVNPTFEVDVFGSYTIQLIVNDGIVNSAVDTVTITTQNSPPVADAGPNQTAHVGDTITLDGSGSSDVDGNPLTYSWSFTARPAGSAAILSDATAVNPTFEVDVFGSYTIQLIVNDGIVNSAVDTVTITTQNSPPVADAGPNQTAHVGDTVTLDGSGSSDVDGNPLTYSWSFTSRPEGSTTTLSDPSAVNPTFVVDVFGSYTIQLMVNDGIVNSAVDTVTITTQNSPPVADAGPNQSAHVGDTITLDGSGSSDVDGNPLTYSWSFTSRPVGSTATLSDPNVVNPMFDVDVFGSYVLQLIVNDGIVDSAADFVTITTDNSPPVANAGPDQTVLVGETVTLNGSGSSDVDGNPLTYSWSFTSQPAGSTATLSDTTAVMPTFNVDVFGVYVLQLIVNDGSVNSTADFVTITTDNSPPVANAGPDQTVLVGEMVTLNGSGSSDVDGNPLTYSWSFTSQPAGSTATLSDTTAVMPTFNVDVFGVYVLQLIVNDGSVDSTADFVTITTENSPPVANAGPDQTAQVTDLVILNGSASSDVDGNALTFTWSLSSRPARSTAALNDINAVMPNFTIDVFGIYVAQLVVNDGTVDSAPDTVIINTVNSAPVANAGFDQTQFVGQTVTLDGSGSFDVDGNTLTYSWTFSSRPAGSTATLTDANTENPSFVIDKAGVYVVQLIVNDGTDDSAPDTVSVTTLNSAPNADAGPDQSVNLGDTVFLNGNASWDIDSDPLTYSWSFTSKPIGGSATLSDPTAVDPSFVADLPGTYVAQLIVNDGTVSSAPDTVVVITVNTAPTADAGPNQVVGTGDTVTLDGSGSSDPENDPLTYLWSFDSVPAGSTASMSDDTAVDPTFVVDLAGVYVLNLVVNDGEFDSAPSQVTITASQPTITLALLNTDLVGVTRDAQVSVSLSSPAPSGGVTVTVTSDAPGTLIVTPPGTVFISEGNSTGQVTVNGVAEGVTTLRGNATGYNEGTLDVEVTLNLITVPTTLNVPLGQSVSVPVSIAPDPAPAGGVVIAVESSNSGIASITTPTITIPAGSYSANASILGNAIGAVQLIASNPNYAADSGDASVTAELNITQANLTINSSFTSDISVRLQSAGADVSAPAPITVTLTSDDSSCAVAVSPVTIPTGQVSTTATISYGGSAVLPCSTSITATAPNLVADSVNVTVNPAPGINLFSMPTNVGSGLQQGVYTARLAAANHGGVTVHIESSDPTIFLVSPNATTAGTASIDLPVANGNIDVHYYIHGLEGVVDTASVSASAPGFTTQTGTVNIVQPAFDIQSLVASTTSLSTDDPFTVRIGVPWSGNSSLQSLQAVRIGGSAVVATVTSNDIAVGEVKTSSDSGASVTVNILPGQSSSPSSVAAGGVAFDPIGGGTVAITASIPGFIATTIASREVTVTTPGISLFSLPTGLGSGLQRGPYTVRLLASNHGGVDVRIQSSEPSTVLVAPDANTVGSEFIDVHLNNGQTDAVYYLQALEGVTGAVNINVSAPGFDSAAGTATVVQPALEIQGLDANTTSLSPDDPFYVRVGIPSAGDGLDVVLPVRTGAAPLTVTISNDTASVGQLVTNSVTGQTITVQVQPGSFNSPTNVAGGGVAFDPIDGGSTMVSATIPGFIATNNANRPVVVSTPGIGFFSMPAGVGSGLQSGPKTARLGASNHGGVTVRIESSNPALVGVAPNASTPGTTFIEQTLTNGAIDVQFYVSGMEGVTGQAIITVTAAGFSTATSTVDVVQPALDIQQLAPTTTSLSVDDPFFVRIGLPVSGNTGLNVVQEIRAGGSALTATITNSAGAIGQLVTSGVTGQIVTVTIQPGEWNSPTNVAAGGVAFDGLTTGLTTVSATIPGFITTNDASREVTVTTPGISLLGIPTDVGSGLQTNNKVARLQASNHGGVTVHIASSDPSIMLVSPDVNTPGSASLEIPVANGAIDANFFVQGLEGVTGSPTVTVTAPGFIDVIGTINVVQPAIDIGSLASTMSASANNDGFYVRVGLPHTSNLYLHTLQVIRAGGTPITATVTNSEAAFGQLVTNSVTGQTVTAQIQPGQYQTPTAIVDGGVAFDPLSEGMTTVSATAPGIISTSAASQNVTVTASLLKLAMNDIIATDTVVIYDDGVSNDDETNSGSLDWLMLLVASGVVSRRYRQRRNLH